MSTTVSALWPSQAAFTLLAALRQANWPIWVGGGAIELLEQKPSTLSYRVKVFGIRKIGKSELIIEAQRYWTVCFALAYLGYSEVCKMMSRDISITRFP